MVIREYPTLTKLQENRFWAKVRKTNSCWKWTAALSGKSGVVRIASVNYDARRVALHLVGRTMYGGYVSNSCENDICVKPDHLVVKDYKGSVDPELIVRLYEEGRSMQSIADQMGFSSHTGILRHLRKAKVTSRKNNDPGYLKHSYDHDFFRHVSPPRAYWAGYIAADGHLQWTPKNGDYCVRIGIDKNDRELLDRLCWDASLSQEVALRTRKNKKTGLPETYAYLEVRGKEWVNTLSTSPYWIPFGKKSDKLIPPTGLDEACAWSFVRGYFDGDGCTTVDGRIGLSSASLPLLEWMVRDVFGSHHAISEGKGAWSSRIGGPTLPGIVKKLYADSTPTTRLGRKYDRLKHLL